MGLHARISAGPVGASSRAGGACHTWRTTGFGFVASRCHRTVCRPSHRSGRRLGHRIVHDQPGRAETRVLVRLRDLECQSSRRRQQRFPRKAVLSKLGSPTNVEERAIPHTDARAAPRMIVHLRIHSYMLVYFRIHSYMFTCLDSKRFTEKVLHGNEPIQADCRQNAADTHRPRDRHRGIHGGVGQRRRRPRTHHVGHWAARLRQDRAPDRISPHRRRARMGDHLRNRFTRCCATPH